MDKFCLLMIDHFEDWMVGESDFGFSKNFNETLSILKYIEWVKLFPIIRGDIVSQIFYE